MSSFTTPIILKPRFSKRFALVLMILHSGALLMLLPLTFPLTYKWAIVIKLFMGLFVLASALHTTRRYLLFLNHPFYGCTLHYDEYNDCIRVQSQLGQPAKIVSGSYSHLQLIVLRLKKISNSKVDTLIIFPDAVNTQTFRQLRVHLRHANECVSGKWSIEMIIKCHVGLSNTDAPNTRTTNSSTEGR